MRLTIASVAYPFALVTADPVGGAEQVLARLDRALVTAGHRSLVIAPEGSAVAGELLAVPSVADATDPAARAQVYAAVRARLAEVAGQADVVHLHGIDFHEYLPIVGPPVLVTLHLPLDWYPPGALTPARAHVWLQPVSTAQARTAPTGAVLTDPIENGVEIARVATGKGRFAFTLGRVCPEKGMDDALDAARLAGLPLLVAGQVFPYPDHQRFFRDRVQPRLSRTRRWVGAVGGGRKARLLARARCLLVPSKAPETSSLVAMEALAAGTPVVAYRAGALPDIVEHGVTGFLVDDIAGMAAAIGEAGTIDPAICRARARERFSLERMTDTYLARYRAMAA